VSDKREGDRKRPYRITLKNRDGFVFAGLWDAWISPKGETINSCTIITTSANTLIEPIHNRMPVILSKKAEEAWLNKDTDVSTLKGLLNTYPAELMESHEVSAIVNNFRNDNPEVLMPV
jgi:putative SOS response-associated peptidase YedK